MRDFWLGLRYFGKAFRFIREHNLYIYYIYPFVLVVGVFVAGFLGIGLVSNEASEYLLGLLGADGLEWNVPEWLEWVVKIILWFLFKIVWYLIFRLIAGTVIQMLLSPVMAYLSERTEELITGKSSPFSIVQLLKDSWRGILISLRNFAMEMLIFTAIFVLSWIIPGLGQIVAAILMFITASYFFGFSFLDYTNERRQRGTNESVQIIRESKGLAIACGTIYNAILMIPFLGILIAPFVTVPATVAATLAMLERDGITGGPALEDHLVEEQQINGSSKKA